MGGRIAIPADLRLFLAMMALLIPARIAHTAQVHAMYVDGGYYLDVARHVRDGHGLVTNLSLYHFGYEHFPHPTSVYPLWPWILGTAARVGDLEALAHWLPMVLSLVAVCAAFLFGRRLWPEPMFPDHVPGLHAGHVFAAGLALQKDFVFFSALPYTEPLGWALLFLLAWRAVVKGPDLSLAWAVETGLWLGLLYLARFQLVVALLAMASSYTIRLALGPDRLRILAHAGVALGVAGAFLGGWFLHIRTFVKDAGISSLMRFDQNHANDLLHKIDIIVDVSGPFSFLLDRAAGLIVAYDGSSSASYTESFYTMHWALPLAAPLLAVALVRRVRRDGWEAVLERLRRPEAAHWFFVVLLAVGSVLSVHVIHKHYNGHWYFGSRQGLMSLPGFLLPLGWLLRQHQPLARVFGVFILCSSLAVGVRTVWVQAASVSQELQAEEPYGELIGWLEAHADPDGRLVVALDSAQVQRVGWRTEHIGYHWVQAHTPYPDYLTLTDRLGVQYIILRKRALDRTWKFLSDRERLERDFERLREEPGNHVIYRRRTPP